MPAALASLTNLSVSSSVGRKKSTFISERSSLTVTNGL